MRTVVIQDNGHNPMYPRIRALIQYGMVSYQTLGQGGSKRYYVEPGVRSRMPIYKTLHERPFFDNETDEQIKKYYKENYKCWS